MGMMLRRHKSPRERITEKEIDKAVNEVKPNDGQDRNVFETDSSANGKDGVDRGSVRTGKTNRTK